MRKINYKFFIEVAFLLSFIFIFVSIVKAETLYNAQMTLQVNLSDSSFYTGDTITVYGDLYDTNGQWSGYSGQATAVISGYITEPPQPSALVQCNPVPPISSNCVGSVNIQAPTSPGSYQMIISLFDQWGNSNEALIPFTVLSKPTVDVMVTADSASVPIGTSTTIRFSSSGATYCIRTDTGTSVGINGSFSTGNLFSSKTFTINCWN